MTRGGGAYLSSYAAEAKTLTANGAGEMELADHFRVDIWTIKLWKVTRRDFLDACKLGREAATDRVEQALFERAIGYSFQAQKIVPQKDGPPLTVTYIEHIPPDVTAARYWLENMRPQTWRNRTEHHVIQHDDMEMSDEELIAIARGGSREGHKAPSGPRGPDSIH